MSSHLWLTIRWLLQLILVAATPVFLFSGIACFSVNEVCVWYMMHSTSLFAACASFLSILLLYMMTVPVVFSIFEEKNKSCNEAPPKEIVPHHHEHNDTQETTTLASALLLALQKQKNSPEEPKKIEGKEERIILKVNSLIKQLGEITELKQKDITTEKEHQQLKQILIDKLQKVLKEEDI